MTRWGLLIALLFSSPLMAAEGGVIHFSGAIVVGTAANPTVINAPFSQVNPARAVTEESMDSFFQTAAVPNASAWQHYLRSSQNLSETTPLPGVVKTITYE